MPDGKKKLCKGTDLTARMNALSLRRKKSAKC